MALTQEQQAEIEALAQQVIDAENERVARLADANAAQAAFSNAQDSFDELRGRLYSQIAAFGLMPAPFIFGEFSFVPASQNMRFLLTPTPTLASVLQSEQVTL